MHNYKLTLKGYEGIRRNATDMNSNQTSSGYKMLMQDTTSLNKISGEILIFTGYRIPYFFLNLTVTQIPTAEMKRLWSSLGTLPTSLLFMLDKMQTKPGSEPEQQCEYVQFVAAKVSQERDTPPLASQGSQAQSCCRYKLSWTFFFLLCLQSVNELMLHLLERTMGELQNSAGPFCVEKAITEISKQHLVSADKKVAKMLLV